MLGISTVWRSSQISDGNELIKEMLDLELDGIELEYRITDTMHKQMLPVLRSSDANILSVHNFFPAPDDAPSGNGGGDLFLLSSTDSHERNQAVKFTAGTMRHAKELEAKAVVLHLGRAPIETIKHELFELYDNQMVGSPAYVELMRQSKKIRAEAKNKTFDLLLNSIEKLAREADRHEIDLGIENRYYFREYPDFDEIGAIFEKFKGARIGYWHDVGHAVVNENLGLINSMQFLEAYGDNLLGIHLHDVNGYYDHTEPGSGKVDFDAIAKYLKPETIKILELRPKVSKEGLLRGIEFLKEKGIM